jgi:hypothetical protein
VFILRNVKWWNLSSVCLSLWYMLKSFRIKRISGQQQIRWNQFWPICDIYQSQKILQMQTLFNCSENGSLLLLLAANTDNPKSVTVTKLELFSSQMPIKLALGNFTVQAEIIFVSIWYKYLCLIANKLTGENSLIQMNLQMKTSTIYIKQWSHCTLLCFGVMCVPRCHFRHYLSCFGNRMQPK